MSASNETQAIHAVISAYGKALNTADSKTIIDLYTADGLFFPNDHGTLSKKHLISSAGTFLKDREFSIDFHVKDVVVQGEFAFVQSTSTTTSRNLKEGKAITTTSRDLFVLHKEQSIWKIYRYMFNSIK